MFGIGMPEMLLILAVALIVIGPKKLPDLAKSLGKALGEFKKATSELKQSIQIDPELKEVKTAFNEINRDLKNSRPAPPAETSAGAAETVPPQSSDPQFAEATDSKKTATDSVERNGAPPEAAGAEMKETLTGESVPDSPTRKG